MRIFDETTFHPQGFIARCVLKQKENKINTERNPKNGSYKNKHLAYETKVQICFLRKSYCPQLVKLVHDKTQSSSLQPANFQTLETVEQQIIIHTVSTL